MRKINLFLHKLNKECDDWRYGWINKNAEEAFAEGGNHCFSTKSELRSDNSIAKRPYISDNKPVTSYVIVKQNF